VRGNGTMAWRRMAIGLFTGGPRKMYLLVKRHLMLITTFLCLNGAMTGGGGCLPALLLSTRRAFPILTQLHSLRSTSSPNVWHRYPKERYPKEIYCHNAQSFNKARDLPVPSTSDHGAVLPFEPDLRLPCGVRRRFRSRCGAHSRVSRRIPPHPRAPGSTGQNFPARDREAGTPPPAACSRLLPTP